MNLCRRVRSTADVETFCPLMRKIESSLVTKLSATHSQLRQDSHNLLSLTRRGRSPWILSALPLDGIGFRFRGKSKSGIRESNAAVEQQLRAAF
jgi:hypothetical protein